MTIDDNDGKPSRLLNHFSFERLKQWKHPPPFIGLGVGAFFLLQIRLHQNRKYPILYVWREIPPRTMNTTIKPTALFADASAGSVNQRIP
jgi:hypothetical protein